MKADKRLSPRKVLRRPVQVRLKDGHAFVAKTTDLAPGGACLIAPEPLPVGVMCLIGFEVPLNGRYRKVNMLAKVSYSTCCGLEGFRIGIQFIEIDETSAAVIGEFMGLSHSHSQEKAENGNDSNRPT